MIQQYDNLDKMYNTNDTSLLSDTLKDYKIIDIEIDYTELIDMLNTDYSDAYNKAKNGYYIFRGDIIPNNIVNRKPGIRISLNNSYNYYNRLLSNVLDTWEEYPKRNQSFICTSSYEYATHWSSTVNLVLPINNTKLGICPKWDMWRSFSEYSGIERMLYFNMDLAKFFEYINNTNTDQSDYIFKYEDNKEITNYLNLTDYNIKKLNDEEYVTALESFEEIFINYKIFKYILLMVKKHNVSIISCLDKILNPEKNMFHTKNIKEYNITLNKKHELWFSDEAIFIDVKYLWQNKKNRIFEGLFN